MSGNYYTIIDEKMPASRVEKIFNTFKPVVVLTDRRNSTKANGYENIIYEDIISNEISDGQTVAESESKIIDTDILYVLFTSGSTGTPKGVIITHRSVLDYIEWAAETFSFGHETVFANQAPFYFDNSVLDVYSTIRNGGTLYIPPQTVYSFPIRLLEFIRDNKINTVFWVPTVLCRIADLNLLGKCDISCLRKVLFAGEVMPARQLNEWIKNLPDAIFANLYGPTEITVDCTYYIVDRDIRDDEPVPIGRACTNTDVMVLNEKNELVKVGEKGELCVRGSSLSFGYYNDPERTDKAFVQNPLNSIYREIIYRTGDIVHYNDYGEIVFDGRADSQIKHSGHRIELGEIETAALSDPGVTSCCCLHEPVSDKLVLFFAGGIEDVELKKHLAGMLSDYMIPNLFLKQDALPLNQNGKIDRVLLKQKLNEIL